MRWFWIDRFIEFHSGKSAKAIKNVSLAEEHLHDHYPGFPVMPGSLMIEGMAQTGGILLGESHGFKHVVILAKIPKVVFHSWACPGDQLVYSAELLDAREEGGMTDFLRPRRQVGSRSRRSETEKLRLRTRPARCPGCRQSGRRHQVIRFVHAG